MDFRADSESALITHACSGNKEAFDRLFSQHQTIIRRVLIKRLRGACEVEDLLQNVACKALTHLSEFRFESSLGTWLIQIAINEARQWWRSYSRRHTISVEELAPGVLDRLQTQMNPLMEKANRFHLSEGELNKYLARLPEKYRCVLVLRFCEEASMAQVAASLQMSLSAVKSRQHRGMRMLRQKLRVPFVDAKLMSKEENIQHEAVIPSRNTRREVAVRL